MSKPKLDQQRAFYNATMNGFVGFLIASAVSYFMTSAIMCDEPLVHGWRRLFASTSNTIIFTGVSIVRSYLVSLSENYVLTIFNKRS